MQNRKHVTVASVHRSERGSWFAMAIQHDEKFTNNKEATEFCEKMNKENPELYYYVEIM